MASVHFSRRALFDIEAIDSYSLERWGETVATKYRADIQAAAQRLGECPELLQRRSEVSLRLRFHFVREHVLICDVIGDRIFVLAVRHAVMDLPQRLAELEPLLAHESELMAQQIVEDEAR